jgi:hypothetical protein
MGISGSGTAASAAGRGSAGGEITAKECCWEEVAVGAMMMVGRGMVGPVRVGERMVMIGMGMGTCGGGGMGELMLACQLSQLPCSFRIRKATVWRSGFVHSTVYNTS